MVRGRIELPTFRFSVLRITVHSSPSRFIWLIQGLRRPLAYSPARTRMRQELRPRASPCSHLRDLAGPAITIFAVVCVVTGISIEMLRYLLDSMRAFWIDMKLRGFATISPSASIAIRLNILVLCASANYGGIPDFVYKGF